MAFRDLFKRPFSGESSLPVKREEDNPFYALQKDINAVFDNFFRDFDLLPQRFGFEGFSPKVDVVESDKEIKISAELPGMDEKDIEVSVNKEAVTIKGEKKAEKEDKGKDYYRMERSYGAFSRTIALPVEVNIDKVEAKFSKGILSIVLPKAESALKETKRIAIKAE
jgi:HSP20 family protein